MSDTYNTSIASYLGLYECPKIGLATIYQLAQLLDEPVHRLAFVADERLSNMGLTHSQIHCIKRYVTGTPIPFKLPKDTHFVPLHDSRYPCWLKQISDPPLFLFVQGDVRVLETVAISVVGNRYPSEPARKVSKALSQGLAKRGWVVVSGLAQGIDAAAHSGALSVGGATVAVLGHGMNYTYPQAHKALRQEIIAKGGCVISECLPNQSAKPYFFPRRNRIVSGLSHGVCIIEAGLRSGTMVTAQHAIAQNRDVFAMPGSVLDEQNWGCHQLIQQGAMLLNHVDDVLSFYPNVENLRARPNVDFIKENSKTLTQDLANPLLLDSVGIDVTSVDDIVSRTQLPIAEVLSQLSTLELSGYVQQRAGGYTRIRGRNHV